MNCGSAIKIGEPFKVMRSPDSDVTGTSKSETPFSIVTLRYAVILWKKRDVSGESKMRGSRYENEFYCKFNDPIPPVS